MAESTKKPRPTTTGLSGVQSQLNGMHQAIRQAAAIGPPHRVRAITLPAMTIPALKAITRIGETQEAMAKQLGQVFKAFKIRAFRFPALDNLVRVLQQERRLNGLGWLPHASAPWELIDAAPDSEIEAILERHYREEWSAVRRTFEAQLDSYTIDEEAKATFREALDAHEAGLYRTTTRTLFPEIERVSRMELLDGATRSFASQKELQKWVMDLLPTDIAPAGRGGWELVKRLIEHLYVRVETPEALVAIGEDPVPNRHAAVHGLVAYPTMQNSINALIMTDFVFVVICAIKRHREAEAA